MLLRWLVVGGYFLLWPVILLTRPSLVAAWLAVGWIGSGPTLALGWPALWQHWPSFHSGLDLARLPQQRRFGLGLVAAPLCALLLLPLELSLWSLRGLGALPPAQRFQTGGPYALDAFFANKPRSTTLKKTA